MITRLRRAARVAYALAAVDQRNRRRSRPTSPCPSPRMKHPPQIHAGLCDERGWHGHDCPGYPHCNGCGWLDRHLTWQPGLCPPVDMPHQAVRSEFGQAFADDRRTSRPEHPSQNRWW